MQRLVQLIKYVVDSSRIIGAKQRLLSIEKRSYPVHPLYGECLYSTKESVYISIDIISFPAIAVSMEAYQQVDKAHIFHFSNLSNWSA